MSSLKRLVAEVHRRSLWQVLSVYLISSWMALQVADTATAALGLPDWVPQIALVLLIVLLPLVLATAFVQEGVGGGGRTEPVPEAEKADGEPAPVISAPEERGAHHRVLTWRNAIAAVVAMLALLTVSAGGYMGLRAAGIGPFATLMSKGVLEERDRIVLADFENHTPDSLLAMAATELFRTALSQSLVVNVADREYVAGVLSRMEKERGIALDYDAAREVAIREGLKAVIAGDVISVGAGYLVSARLVAAEPGEVLWTDSETARDSTALIDAIDALSRRLRERVGESLRTIRPTKGLSRVTTSSLAALKKYSQALRARVQEGDDAKAIALLQEATRADTLFASAYRALGVTYYNRQALRPRWAEAFSTAFELSDRLPDRERYSVEGIYYWLVTEELDKAATAYRALMEIDPDFIEFNLAAIYTTLRDFAAAEPVFRRSLESDSLFSTAYNNLAITQVALGKLDEARLTLQRFGARLPNHPDHRQRAADFAAMQGDYDEAEAQLRAWRERFKESPPTVANSTSQLAALARLRGLLAEAERHIAEVMRSIRESQGRPRWLIANSTVQSRMDLWFKGDTAAALRRVEAMLDLYPLDSILLSDRPLGALVNFYARAGQPEQARAYLTEWEERAEFKGRSFQESHHLLLGHIAMSEGRPRDAITEYREADRLDDCPVCTLGALAFAYDHAGMPDSVLAVYERYVTTPWLWRRGVDSWWLATAYERLGQLYEEHGNTEKAIYYNGKFVELWQDADPELQPRVEAARRAIEALSTDR